MLDRAAEGRERTSITLVDTPQVRQLVCAISKPYFKPFGADGQTHWWLEDGIDHLRDELLPPLRPFAIKISLVPRDEYGDQDEATVRAYLATILK